MGSVSALLAIVLSLALSVSSVIGDDPWFPGWGDSSPPPPPLFPAPTGGGSPAPYYDAPPYLWPPPPYVGSTPPLDSPPYSEPTPDAPPAPYEGSTPPFDSPPYTEGPSSPSLDFGDGPSSPPDCPPFPWFSFSLAADNTDKWPAPYSPDMTIEDALGPEAETVYGQTSMLDALTAKGDDGFSNLLKEAITALLNCVDKHFKYTEDEVKQNFKGALSSETAAAVQAQMFANANSGYGTFG